MQNLFFSRAKPSPISDNAINLDANLQWWYVDAFLDDGSIFEAFLIPKLPWKIDGYDNVPGQPALDIIYRKPDGETIRERCLFEPSELVPLSGTFGAAIGKNCSFAYENPSNENKLGRYIFKAKAEKLEYDMELNPLLPSWTPLGAGGRTPRILMMLLQRSLSTKDYFHYVPYVPRGRVSGKIKVNGKTIEVKGTGYHEQGHMNLPLYDFMPAWYWLHIDHPPWTIFSGTANPPKTFPLPLKGTIGGMGYIQKGEKRLMSTLDYSGLMVNWKRIGSRDPDAVGEMNMAWEADVRLMRPGLMVKLNLVSKDVLEYMHFEIPEKPDAHPYWGQTVADAKVKIIHGFKKTEFETQCLLETMKISV